MEISRQGRYDTKVSVSEAVKDMSSNKSHSDASSPSSMTVFRAWIAEERTDSSDSVVVFPPSSLNFAATSAALAEVFWVMLQLQLPRSELKAMHTTASRKKPFAMRSIFSPSAASFFVQRGSILLWNHPFRRRFSRIFRTCALVLKTR